MRFLCFLIGLFLPVVFVSFSYAGWVQITGTVTSRPITDDPIAMCTDSSCNLNASLYGEWIFDYNGPGSVSVPVDYIGTDGGNYQTAFDMVAYGVDTYWGEYIGKKLKFTRITYYPTYQRMEVNINYAFYWEPDPEHCSNGVMDDDETGVDCGGSCSESCVPICPDGTEYLTGPDGESRCYWYGLPDNYGNCPSGSLSTANLEGWPVGCYQSYDSVLGASGTEIDDVSLPGFASGTFNVVENVTPEVITNNGDGTSTGIQTTTVTNADGTTTTTTTTTLYGSEDGTGDVLGTTTATEGEIPVEENPENYDLSVADPEYDGEIKEEDLPEKDSLTDLLEDSIANSPFVSVITGSGVDLSGGVSQLSWNYKGHQIVFDLSDRGGALSAMGTVLVFLSVVSSYFIVVGRS